jgi:hypothetical protein
MGADEEKQAAEDAKRAEEQRIADLVNKAAADHAKRAMAKVEKQIEERDVRIAQLEARLSDRDAGKQTPAAGAPAASQAAPVAADPRLAELEARMRAADKRAEEERAAREGERKARLAEEERNLTVQALAAAEITGELQEGALLVLQAQGRIGRDEAGKVVWLEQKEGYVDKIPVADGVRKWATEGAGKAYLPARGVGGSGTKPPTGAKPPAAGNRNERIASAKKDLVAAFFGGQGQS